MSATSRRAGGGSQHDVETLLLWAVLILIAVVVTTLTAAAHLGVALDGRGQHLPANPFRLVLQLADGSTPWPRSLS
jgi:hypothetical protein